jgi:hypothetical protein
MCWASGEISHWSDDSVVTRCYNPTQPRRCNISTEIVKQEIIDWHQFLHKFFRGEIEAGAFNRMEKVLTPEFKYVSVWGQAGGREAFLESVPNGYGALPDIEVFVENIEVSEIAPEMDESRIPKLPGDQEAYIGNYPDIDPTEDVKNG